MQINQQAADDCANLTNALSRQQNRRVNGGTEGSAGRRTQVDEFALAACCPHTGAGNA